MSDSSLSCGRIAPNRPLQKASHRIKVATVSFAFVGALFGVVAGIKAPNLTWDSLSSRDVSALSSKLSAISPEPVKIHCAGQYCKDLAEDFEKAFKKAGWTDVKVTLGGGLGVDGIKGIRVGPRRRSDRRDQRGD